MRKTFSTILSAFIAVSICAQRTERTSENTPRLAEELKRNPQLDANKDGLIRIR